MPPAAPGPDARHDGDRADGAAMLRRLLRGGQGADARDGPCVGRVRLLDPTSGKAKTAFRQGEPLWIQVLVTGAPHTPVDVEVGVLGPADLPVSACGPALATGGAALAFVLAVAIGLIAFLARRVATRRVLAVHR